MLKGIVRLGPLLCVLILPLLSGAGGKMAAEKHSTKSVTTDSGLKFLDLVVGQGRLAELGDTATVHYTGWL